LLNFDWLVKCSISSEECLSSAAAFLVVAAHENRMRRTPNPRRLVIIDSAGTGMCKAHQWLRVSAVWGEEAPDT